MEEIQMMSRIGKSFDENNVVLQKNGKERILGDVRKKFVVSVRFRLKNQFWWIHNSESQFGILGK